MIDRVLVRATLAAFPALLGVSLGCDGTSRSPSAPAAVATVATPVPVSVVSVSPPVGSTGGETFLTVAGSGFQPGASVTLGGTTVQGRLDSRDPNGTTLYLEAPPQPAGTMDVVVTNPGGTSGRLTAGYTYASPDSFDFNGSWSGFGTAGQDIPIVLTIENDLLISVSCDTHATLDLAPPLPVSGGGFSFSRGDGVAVSGTIVSASQAVGTLELAPCSATRWRARKQ